MSNTANKAATVTGPEDAGANEFGCLKMTATNTHEANAVPSAWKNRFVRITYHSTTPTDYMEFGWSSAASPEIDLAVAASSAGASAKVGGPLYGMQAREVLVPDFGSGIDTKFVRESSAASKVAYIELAERG